MRNSKKATIVVAVTLLLVALFFIVPRYAVLNISTEPVEGAIYVDSELAGTGTVRVELPLGSHTVSYGEVLNYNCPQPIKVDLTEGGADIVGSYVRQTGVLVIENMVSLKMPGVTAGLIALHVGKLYLNETLIGEGQLCITLETGCYVLEFGDVAGFVTPQPTRVMVTNSSSEKVTAIYAPKFQDVSVQVARQLMEAPVQIVDVRGPDEYRAGHLKGVINIPLPVLKGKMAELDKDMDVLVYCASGMGSVLAAGMLQAEGFKVYHMDGGVIDWVDAGYPLIKED
jgi:rhodanese-related sulfurtransferase